MGDYVPLYDEGDTTTWTAGAAITGGQLVYVSTDDTVQKTAGATTAWVGVAAFDASTGQQVTLYHGGVQKLTASGAITAGDQVISAANGAVASLAAAAGAAAGDINAARQVVGIARTSATDGNTVVVRMAR